MPNAFYHVAKARDLAVDLEARRHGRYATITPHLKRLGPAALLPMLDALVFDGPDRSGMSDKAWLTLQVGLLEAVGALRDPKAVVVLEAVLDEPTVGPEVTRAAAEALGRVGTDRAVTKLIALSIKPGPKQQAVIRGMGDCRRFPIAQHLAALLRKQPEDAVALHVVKALGGVGNAWAWQTPPVRASERDVTRALAARTLVQAFVSYDGEVREAAAKALLVVDHPSTGSLVSIERQRATTDGVRDQLDRLARRLEKNPLRNP
jgi:HEAT repeat protein